MKMGSVYCVCSRCEATQAVGLYKYQAGKGKCYNCGGSVYEIPRPVKTNVKSSPVKT
jgi:hypothetical protein